MKEKEKKYHKVLVMNEEDCRLDDERRAKKRKKTNFSEWIKDYLKEEKSLYGEDGYSRE